MDPNCGKCGRVLEKTYCTDCVKEVLQEETDLVGERLLSLEKRIESAEGEIVRLQNKLMQLR